MKVAVLKKQPRKALVWPWVLIIGWLLFTIAPIAAFYGVFYDSDTKKTKVQEGFTLQSLGKRVIVDSLDNTASTGLADLVVTESDMDSILDAALNKSGLKNDIIKKSYVKINTTNYDFFIDVDAVIFKTRLRIKTTLVESEDKSGFIFNINDVAVGRASGLASGSKDFINHYLNEEIVNTFFEKAGLTMKFDKERYAIVYKKKDILTDVNKMSGSGSDTMGLYFSIIQALIEDDKTIFNMGTGNFIDATFDLSVLKTNEMVTDTPTSQIKIDSSEVTTRCKEKLLKLVQNEVLDPTKDDMALMFAYLFGGWTSLNSKQQEAIQDIDFSSIGIKDKTTYTGFGLNNSDTYLKDKMKTNLFTFKDFTDNKTDVTLIDENDFNTYIAGRNVIGFTKVLDRFKEDGSYKLNYITVDNFYSNIYEADGQQVAEFIIKVNVNGYSTSLTFPSLAETNEAQDSMTFKVEQDKIRFGTLKDPSLNDQFFSIVATTLNSGDDSISANKEDRSITMTFANFLEDAKNTLKADAAKTYSGVALEYAEGKIDELLAPENASIKITGATDRSGIGELQLQLKKNDFVKP